MSLQLAQRLAGIDAPEHRIQRLQAAQCRAQFIAGRRFGRQGRALAGPAQRRQQRRKTTTPSGRKLAARRGARGILQRSQMRQQLRHRQRRPRIGRQPPDGADEALQAGFGRQPLAQTGFDACPRIGLQHIGRPAAAAEQGAELGLRHALRMDEDLQQAQRDIDQGLPRQRRTGDEGVVALQRGPAGAHRIGMQGRFQRRFEQPPPRRQVGHGNAHAGPRHAPGPRFKRYTFARPARRRQAFGFRLEQRGTERGRRIAAAEIDAKQCHAARFEHHQQARQQRVGRDETGDADTRRQAA